jgi:hypothetical protein
MPYSEQHPELSLVDTRSSQQRTACPAQVLACPQTLECHAVGV